LIRVLEFVEMKKMFRIIPSILGILLLIGVLAVIGIGLFADNAIKSTIEVAGAKALKVAVDVTKANLTVVDRSLTLQKVSIANPAGYQHDTLLQLDSAHAAVEVKSLLSDVVKIKTMRLEGIELVLEQRGLSNNLQEILDSLPEDIDKYSTGKELQIDLLEISDITVKAKLLPIPGKLDTLTLRLAPIKLTDLGTNQKMDVASLTAKILLAIAGGIAKQGAGILPDGMVSTLGSALDKTAKLGMKLLEAGSKNSQDLIRATEKLGNDLSKGIQGILKPKKEDQPND
jgi:hypothetical protein